MKKDLISIYDLTAGEINEIFSLTGRLKKNDAGFSRSLCGKTLALIFQKPSNRTRVSFEVGMYQLGGHSVYLGPSEIKLGVREEIKDVARTLSRYVNGIVLRTFEHSNVMEMAEYASIPIINGLSDFSHPCQALADIYTIIEKGMDISKIKFAYIGDGNNVCNSLLFACAKLGINMSVASPSRYQPQRRLFQEAAELALSKGKKIALYREPSQAVCGADVIYTDVWSSMGQEKEAQKRRKDFKGYQINSRLLKTANPGAIVMHCLPAHRGEEITDDVIDGAQSVVFDQAENRMHVQKAILIKFLGKAKKS